MENLIITGHDLTITDIVEVSRYNRQVELSSSAIDKINQANDLVKNSVNKKKIIYGITTGFGKFSDTKIKQEQAETLQKNLIISHACGIGRPFDDEIVRAMMILRINSLAKGFSGIRLFTINKIIELLNKGLHPIIPEKGSLGASGDLAPLSHMVLGLLGEGKIRYQDEILEAKNALIKANIEPLDKLTFKEGLALINGTQAMVAVGSLATYDAIKLAKIADIAGSLTLEALRGITCAFDDKVHSIARPHQGQINTATNLRKILQNSKMTTKQGDLRIQDPYVLRCIPQVHGATKDAIRHIKAIIEIEINSVTDNPIIFVEEEQVISAGNFHGQPNALAFDFLKIAVSELANIAERRLERLINPQLSFGLPAFLTTNGGLNSGFMIVQYSAASLVSENKILAHPASVDSIPSSANQEDHVSMGTIAARGAREILDNSYKVIAMEIFTACQAIDLRMKRDLGLGSNIAYNQIRSIVDFIEKDVIMYERIEAVDQMIRTEEFLSNITKEINLLI